MQVFNINQLIDIAEQGSSKDWEYALDFINNYQGNDDEIHGLKLFVHNHISDNPRKALIAFISEVRGAKPKEIKRFRLIRFPSWAMVAAASLLLVAGLVVNQYVHRVSIHMVDDALPVYLSNEDILLNKGMAQYKKGDYAAALTNFEKLNSDTAIYYSAVCYELNGNYAESVNKLKKVASNSVFYSKSQIRLAAVYIELGKVDQAKAVLDNIKPANEAEAQRIKSIKIRLY